MHGSLIAVGAGDARFLASVRRLKLADYTPVVVWELDSAGDWPGDYPGRLILALATQARVTGQPSVRLRELLNQLPGRLNLRGYLGPVGEHVDEQQLAGHGWLVSGLLATGDQQARALAHHIVDRLYRPLSGRLSSYPRRTDDDDGDGAASGSIRAERDGWRLSSDTYCVFIALEGLVAAFADAPDPELGDLIEEFRVLVERDDLVERRAQLHASMTAARCLLEFGQLTGRTGPVRTAAGLYDVYVRHGRTLNHATFNWFGRPDSWTEPCAVVDTFLLARGLWIATGDVRYLHDAQAIEVNGLGHAQRPNGGFGLDSVTTHRQPWLATSVYEAPWCCTMRGAVGLAQARLGAVRVIAPTEVSIDFWHCSTVTLPGGTVLTVATDHPNGAQLTLSATGADELVVNLQLPDWASSNNFTVSREAAAVRTEHAVRLVLAPGNPISVSVPFGYRTLGTAPGQHFRGPLLLGRAEGGEVQPIADIFTMTERDAVGYRALIAFDRD